LDRLAAATAVILDQQSMGVLNLSTLDSFAAKWFIPRLFRFRQAHGDIDVRLETSEKLADSVSDGIDFASSGPRNGGQTRPGRIPYMFFLTVQAMNLAVGIAKSPSAQCANARQPATAPGRRARGQLAQMIAHGQSRLAATNDDCV
jgi:DNA-binding transcriptional LysR family regulator